jgi:hypothetical protein
MGAISENSKIIGLYGGSATSKEGRHFSYFMKPGKWAPFLEKIETPSPISIPAGVVFGTAVTLLLKDSEQKFGDYNSSFTHAAEAVIHVNK